VSGAPQALLLPDGDRLVRVAQGPAILTLRDAMGRTVAQWMLTGRGPSEQRIATATHAPGVYTLEVLAGDRRTTLRIPIAR